MSQITNYILYTNFTQLYRFTYVYVNNEILHCIITQISKDTKE